MASSRISPNSESALFWTYANVLKEWTEFINNTHSAALKSSGQNVLKPFFLTVDWDLT